jgi:Uma2 family endonuclease
MSSLIDGQRLTREEFMRRWEALPDLKLAELIDGVVYLPPPVSPRQSTADGLLQGWLSIYSCQTTGVQSGTNGTWLMLESAPQPNGWLRIRPNFGGQSIDSGYFPQGAPELIIEVGLSSTARDREPKLELFRRAGVREYLTFAVDEQELVWQELINGRYNPMIPDKDDVFQSRVFRGLWLDRAAVIRGDGKRVMEVLEEGIGSTEHSEFVRTLARSNVR